MSEHCPVCGGLVKIEGKTTMSLTPDYSEIMKEQQKEFVEELKGILTVDNEKEVKGLINKYSQGWRMSEYIDKKQKEFRNIFMDKDFDVWLENTEPLEVLEFIRTALEEQEKALRLKHGAIVSRLEGVVPSNIDLDKIAKAIIKFQSGGE